MLVCAQLYPSRLPRSRIGHSLHARRFSNRIVQPVGAFRTVASRHRLVLGYLFTPRGCRDSETSGVESRATGCMIRCLKHASLAKSRPDSAPARPGRRAGHGPNQSREPEWRSFPTVSARTHARTVAQPGAPASQHRRADARAIQPTHNQSILNRSLWPDGQPTRRRLWTDKLSANQTHSVSFTIVCECVCLCVRV